MQTHGECFHTEMISVMMLDHVKVSNICAHDQVFGKLGNVDQLARNSNFDQWFAK